MKYSLLLCSLICLSSCAYQPILKSNIKTVHILYKHKSWGHHDGYKLYDGSRINWDKKNNGVRVALDNYRAKLGVLQKENPDYLEHLIINKKNAKYRPIKVVPLKEFGYIEMNSNQLIFYGIMGDKTFIDLTDNRVYY